ncbi:UNKNOWN [Stylonychia lemnae]|uniref:Uncharacterized protein n=1 Tax=Stylonychia lemnae TaxID=5949 RepID=A0A078AMS8_STYLE|nr:UNKNOWN [Stylonychia lemnae]|eukprot:CDW83459.1 UNKNOWN [Stylonychia lemnae]
MKCIITSQISLKNACQIQTNFMCFRYLIYQMLLLAIFQLQGRPENCFSKDQFPIFVGDGKNDYEISVIATDRNDQGFLFGGTDSQNSYIVFTGNIENDFYKAFSLVGVLESNGQQVFNVAFKYNVDVQALYPHILKFLESQNLHIGCLQSKSNQNFIGYFTLQNSQESQNYNYGGRYLIQQESIDGNYQLQCLEISYYTDTNYYDGEDRLFVILIDYEKFFDKNQDEILVAWYESSNNPGKKIYWTQILSQLEQYQYLYLIGRYYHQTSGNSYGVIYRSQPTGKQFGCYGFNDLVSDITDVGQKTEIMKNFIQGQQDQPSIDVDWVSPYYSIKHQMTLELTDIRKNQHMFDNDNSCSLVGGYPKIEVSQGKSFKNTTVCFIGCPCTIKIGNYSIKSCSDVSFLEFSITDKNEDLDQITRQQQIDFSTIILEVSLQETSNSHPQKKIFIGKHTIVVKAFVKLKNGFTYSYHESQFTLQVDFCQNQLNYIKFPNFKNMFFMIGQDAANQTFINHSFEPSGCTNPQYYLFLNNGRNLPSCIYLDQDQGVIVIKCTESNLNGKVTAIINEKDQIGQAIFINRFQIYLISNAYMINTAAPMFLEPLQDQTLVEGQLLTYKLPQIVDQESRSYYIETNFGQSAIFCKFKSGQIEFLPQIGFSGQYEIVIKLKDSLKPDIQNKYTLKVNVLASESLNITEVNRIKQIKEETKGFLRARIKKVTNTGHVYILFSDKMLLYANFQNYLNDSLEVIFPPFILNLAKDSHERFGNQSRIRSQIIL